jgi:hypothetical protein
MLNENLNPHIYYSPRERTPLEIRSRAIAVRNHAGIIDSCGLPYDNHTKRVGDRAAEIVLRQHDMLIADPITQNYPEELLNLDPQTMAIYARAVGDVHDIIEDVEGFDRDGKRLIEEGFPTFLIPVVLNVTIIPGESYFQTICRAKDHPISRACKMADLTDNSTLARINLTKPGTPLPKFFNPLEKALKRQQKYMLSYLYLANQISRDKFKSQLEVLDNPKPLVKPQTL